MSGDLGYPAAFWEQVLSPDAVPTTVEQKCNLVISLIIFLSLPIHHLLVTLFSSNLEPVRDRVSHFMGYHRSARDPDAVFHPRTIFHLWHERWPHARGHLHDHIIQPCAEEIALQESDQIIQEPTFQIRTNSLTIEGMRQLLNPRAILATIQTKAPFTYSFLRAFTASPNAYRSRQRSAEGGVSSAEGLQSSELAGDAKDDPAGEEDDPDDAAGVGHEWKEQFPGFSRNPVFVSHLRR